MIVIFYIDEHAEPQCLHYGSKELPKVIKMCETLRTRGMRHVCTSSEPAEMVGKPGVSSIENGKTPDGHPYEWSKAGRAGKMRAADDTKQITATRNGD